MLYIRRTVKIDEIIFEIKKNVSFPKQFLIEFI